MVSEKIPNSSLDDQESFYNKYWDDLKPFGNYKLLRIARIIKHLGEIRKAKRKLEILDLGCGDGRSVPIWNVIGKATGFDLSSSAMQKAKELFPHISFFSGDALNTGFNNDMFDVIISQEVLEHIEHQEKYLAECSRILRNNGFLILTTPNKYYFDSVKGGNYSKQPIENILSPSELQSLAIKYFNIIQIESLIIAHGDFGIYKLLSNSILVAILRKMKIDTLRVRFMEKCLMGVHIILIARKK